MNFSDAATHLLGGGRITRRDWPGGYLIISGYDDDPQSISPIVAEPPLDKDDLLIIYKESREGRFEYVPDRHDLFSDDWMLIEEELELE